LVYTPLVFILNSNFILLLLEGFGTSDRAVIDMYVSVCLVTVIANDSFCKSAQSYFLDKFIIKKINPIKKSPIPDKSPIVFNGCPIVVVKPKPHKNQPMIIDTIENEILLFLFIK
jgi:hypothetical protein